jgi:hypothetical protein
VRESAADLERLQATLDASRAAAGAHLRRAFGEATATAADVAHALDGIFEMHLAVVTPAGAPLVAPVDGILFHGDVWFGLPAGSVRAAIIHREARVSASYNAGDVAFIVHGEARLVDDASALGVEFGEVSRELYVARYGPVFLEWDAARRARQEPGVEFTGWIEPRRLYAKV